MPGRLGLPSRAPRGRGARAVAGRRVESRPPRDGDGGAECAERARERERRADAECGNGTAPAGPEHHAESECGVGPAERLGRGPRQGDAPVRRGRATENSRNICRTNPLRSTLTATCSRSIG